jgi:hypothetical protein
VLIAAGTDVKHKNIVGVTAPSYATRSGYLDIVNVLIAAGADVNIPDEYGETVLFNASYHGFLDVVNVLIAAGADVNHINGENETALFYNRHLETINTLISAGVDVNHKNNEGETALFNAYTDGNLEIINTLLTAGADLSIQNNLGETADTERGPDDDDNNDDDNNDDDPPDTLSVREPLSVTEWYKMCSSEINVVSQTLWVEDTDNSNSIVITVSGKDNCYDAAQLASLLKNKNLRVVKWKGSGQTTSVDDMSVGWGFDPDPESDTYVKILPEYSVYINLEDVKNMLYISTKRYFVCNSLGTHRVGNLQGSRGSGRVHGQGPPFPELFNLSVSNTTPSFKVREERITHAETTAQDRAAFATRVAASRLAQASRLAAAGSDDDL